jgi:hypothetical protein
MDSDDSTGACVPCKRRGLECGPRTWPMKTAKRQRPSATSPVKSLSIGSPALTSNSPDDSRLATLEAKVNELEMKLRLSRESGASNSASLYLLSLPFLIPRSNPIFDYFQQHEQTDWPHGSGSVAGIASLNNGESSQSVRNDNDWLCIPREDHQQYLCSDSQYNISSGIPYQDPFTSNIHDRPDFLTIATVIWSSTPQFTAPITNFLDMHFRSIQARITGFRATTLNLLSDQLNPWPVVEWREDGDTDVLVIFKVEDNEPCSYLMHFGMGLNYEVNGKRWRRSAVRWLVPSMDYLQELFTALHHLLGLVSVKEEEMLRLCFSTDLILGAETVGEYLSL